MYLKKHNIIIDINTVDNLYLIFLNNGFKYEYLPYKGEGKPLGCPDEIDNNDIIRAREHDGKDISHLKGKVFKPEEIEENIKKSIKFLMSEDYPFKKAKKLVKNKK